MKKLFSLIICAVMGCTLLFGQAKKPTLMVVPSDAWCNEHGFMQNYDNQGMTNSVPNYAQALQNNKDLNNVISKINSLMADRGFPLKDLQQTIKSVNNIAAEDMVTTSKAGDGLMENPIDRLRATAKADIILELDWTVNTAGPKKTITFNLRGLDAYSNKQVAGAEGTGAPSFAADVPTLLEEAVLNHIDNFNNQLQAHFDDMFENGREVVLDIRVFDNGSGVDLETEFGGEELTTLIEDWVNDNTVQHRFNLSDATETRMLFEQVRIPLYRPNGTTPMDTREFARQLQKYLKGAPCNLTSKVVQQGLGRARVIIGDK